MRLLTSLFSPASLLALVVLAVLASSADAGIFRKRRCNGGGCSTPAASSCSAGSGGSSVRYVQPSSYANAQSGAAVQSCPGGRCPIQR